MTLGKYISPYISDSEDGTPAELSVNRNTSLELIDGLSDNLTHFGGILNTIIDKIKNKSTEENKIEKPLGNYDLPEEFKIRHRLGLSLMKLIVPKLKNTGLKTEVIEDKGGIKIFRETNINYAEELKKAEMNNI